VQMRKAIPLLAVALAAVGAVAAIALAHRGNPASATAQSLRMHVKASTFLTSVVKLLIANRYGAAWATLNPAHQDVAPRAEYISCEQQSPIRAHLVSLRVLAKERKRVRLVTHGPRVSTVAVTFGAILFQEGSKVPLVLTLHAVPAGSGWTWILPLDRYAFYRDGGCKTSMVQTSESP
jgi:hypothetical protein